MKSIVFITLLLLLGFDSAGIPSRYCELHQQNDYCYFSYLPNYGADDLDS